MLRRQRGRLLMLVVLALVLSPRGYAAGTPEVRSADAPRYVFTDLGTLGGDASRAYAINDRGRVVGASFVRQGTFHGFIYPAPSYCPATAGTRLCDIVPYRGHRLSIANGINNRGKIVGETDAYYRGSAYLLDRGKMYLLGRLGGHFSGANDINNYGQIVGYSGSDDGSVKSFLWQPVEPGATSGSMIELPALPLGSGGQAFGINARGVVTGWADIEGFPHAFLWISDMPNGIHGQIVDLGRLPGGDVSIGRAVNSGGQVAGEATSPEGDRAFLWSPVSAQPGAGTMVDLGSLGGPASGAYGINDSGQVVGFSSDVSGLAIAFLYTGGTMHDLNALLIEDYDGVTLRAAFDINELGDIVGVAEVNGEGHAFLLTPTDRER